MTALIDDYPCWLRITGNPLWPYEIKATNNGNWCRINYDEGLVERIGTLRRKGMTYSQISKELGEKLTRVRHICEKRIGE